MQLNHRSTIWQSGTVPFLGSLGLLLFIAWIHQSTPHWDDLTLYNIPMRRFYHESLNAGERFDWMPTIFGGYFLSGEGQVGAYHPFHLLIYRFLSFELALQVELSTSYLFAFAGMFLFLRRCVDEMSSAWVGAILFAFCGFNLKHYTNMNAVAVISHLPWCLLCIKMICESTEYRSRACCGLALLTGSQILLGYPQYFVYSNIAEILFAAVFFQSNVVNHLQFIWAKTIGVLLGGVQLFTTWEVNQASERADLGREFFFQGSLQPVELVQLFSPFIFKQRAFLLELNDFAVYSGALMLILCFWLAQSLPTSATQRRMIWAGVGMMAISLFMALGENSGWSQIKIHLPVVSNFRTSVRALVLFQFAAALLSAFGFDAIQKVPPTTAGAFSRMTAAITAFSILAAVIIRLMQSESYASWVWQMAGPIAIATTGFLLVQVIHKKSWAFPLLIVWSLIDLGIYGTAQVVFAAPAGSIEMPPGQVGDRVACDPSTLGSSDDWEIGDLFAVHGFPQIDGYSGLEPKPLVLEPLNSVKLLQAAGVRWVWVPAMHQSIEGLIHRSDAWLEVPDQLPRFFLANSAIESATPRKAIPSIDIHKTVIVDRRIDLDETQHIGNFRLVRDAPGHLKLNMETPSPQLFVVLDRFHSGWHIFIDGEESELVRVNGDFMGCVVPGGMHRIEFEFAPASLVWGKRVSLFGLCLLLVTVAGGRDVGFRTIRPSSRDSLVEN